MAATVFLPSFLYHLSLPHSRPSAQGAFHHSPRPHPCEEESELSLTEGRECPLRGHRTGTFSLVSRHISGGCLTPPLQAFELEAVDLGLRTGLPAATQTQFIRGFLHRTNIHQAQKRFKVPGAVCGQW